MLNIKLYLILYLDYNIIIIKPTKVNYAKTFYKIIKFILGMERYL
jgi:hypothetical protein